METLTAQSTVQLAKNQVHEYMCSENIRTEDEGINDVQKLRASTNGHLPMGLQNLNQYRYSRKQTKQELHYY